MRLLRALILVLVFAPATLRAADQGGLVIHTADGKEHAFTIEIASTDEEREIGLMNRPSMEADHGMLFDFREDQPIYMWMKDTLIPLDMIFIDRHGRIAGIAQRTVPMSQAIIPSPGPIRAVLEINGGTAERLHIAIGDVVRHPMFAP